MPTTTTNPITGQIDPALLTALSAFGPTGILIGLGVMGLGHVAELLIANSANKELPTPEEWKALLTKIMTPFDQL